MKQLEKVRNMANLLQLKIVLDRIEPAIWRRVLVRDSMNFLRLHTVIQDAFGWWDCHLHEFRIGKVAIGFPDEDDEPDRPVLYGKKIDVDRYIKRERQKLKYVYDFGDNWNHTITVEKITKDTGWINRPVCIDGARACPPEDCGGASGYEEFLEIIKNKKHPEHRSMLNWAGGKFDPEYFDMKKANRSIRSLKHYREILTEC